MRVVCVNAEEEEEGRDFLEEGRLEECRDEQRPFLSVYLLQQKEEEEDEKLSQRGMSLIVRPCSGPSQGTYRQLSER